MSDKRHFTGLRAKLVRLILATLLVSGVGILSAVILIQVRSSAESLAAIEAQIRASIEDKGRVLAKSHAIALTDLANDNAFMAMNALVGQAVQEDPDLVYGLFLSADGDPWAYFAPNVPPLVDGAPQPAVDQNAWRVLRVEPEQKDITQLTSRSLHVFGEDVVEFAVPVLDEQEVLGTIRYGVSTQRMRTALTDARQLSSQALRRTLAILGGIVALTTFAMLLLGLGSAARITRPLSILSEAAHRLAGGDREVRVDIASGDELEQLGNSFNSMVGQLKRSYDDLEKLNKTLEHRVEARTARLLARNEEMRIVLDTVDQGLVAIYPDGTLSAERSAAFDRWFPNNGETDSLSATVGGNDERRRLQLELAWEALADGFLPTDLALEQLPHHFEIEGRHFAFEYKPKFEDERLENVLLVVSDVTSEVERVKAETAQQEQMRIFQRVTQDRFGFVEFFNEAEHLARAILAPPHSCREELLRDIHTLKGNCGIFGVETVASVCHQIEAAMIDESRLPTDAECTRLGVVWSGFAQRVHELIGNDSADIVEVSYGELQSIIHNALNIEAGAQLVKQLEQLKFEPTKSRFTRVGRQLRVLAQRLGRCEVKVEVDHQNLRLPADRWARFWSAFAHVIRNAVDHGLETPDERMSSHKPPTATITLRSRLEGDTLLIEIEDDGRGINWTAIREKAAALGLPHQTPAELTAALFADGVSSRHEVSETSGRGVGLSAVRRACEELAGDIAVNTTAGRGTRMSFSFPSAQNLRPLLPSLTPGARPSLTPKPELDPPSESPTPSQVLFARSG